MAYEVPPLPYDYAALEPHIDEQTMRIHHGKHHQAYVTKLNGALEGHADLASKSIEALVADVANLPDAIRTAVRNNGGGHLNHSMFWTSMSGSGGGTPSGALADAIGRDLGGLDKLQAAFGNAGATRFGSGWAWLCVNADRKLCVCSTPNQDHPTMAGIAECPGQPILGLDVWEHAYYLKYQNRRPDYITAWWNVVDWGVVGERFAAAQ